MFRCIEVESLSRVYARVSGGDKKFRVALVGLDPPTLVILGKGFYVCKDVEFLKKLVESALDGDCLSVVYLVKSIDEKWLKQYLPIARYGDSITEDGVVATLRVEQKRFSLRRACVEKGAVVYVLEEALRKQKAEALLNALEKSQAG